MTPQPLAPAADCPRHPCRDCQRELKAPYRERIDRAEAAGLGFGWLFGSAPAAAGLLLLTFNPEPALQFGLGPILLAAGIAIGVGVATRYGRRMDRIKAEMNQALATAGLASPEERSRPCRC